MNFTYKCLLLLLLTALFTSKVAMPVMQLYKLSLQSDIEEQEQKTSEENNSEKTDAEKTKTEIADLASVQYFTPAHLLTSSLYHSYFVSLLPSRYFAVPTPPPWTA